MTKPDRVHLVLPQEPHSELLAAQAVDRVGLPLGFSRDTLSEVKLAVVEACLNALEYGTGVVEVELVGHPGSPARLEVSVVDYGPGFVPGEVPAPRLAEKLRAGRKRGWGLALIRRLMDEVEIESRPGNTRVRMVRQAGGN